MARGPRIPYTASRRVEWWPDRAPASGSADCARRLGKADWLWPAHRAPRRGCGSDARECRSAEYSVPVAIGLNEAAFDNTDNS